MKHPPLGPPLVRNRHHSDYALGSLTTVTIYHDYSCPWCWVGVHQAKRLREEYGIVFDWRGAELNPPGYVAPPKPKPRVSASNPVLPKSRFDTFLEKEGMVLPSPRPKYLPEQAHKALLAAEYVWMEHGPAVFDAFNESVYHAHWIAHEDIMQMETLTRLGEAAGADPEAMCLSVLMEEYADHILRFDEEAYRHGVRHVPAFLFGAEEMLAEAEYSALAGSAERFLVRREKFLGVK